MNEWRIVSEVGYTFEFESERHGSTVIRIIARNEQEAWKKLKRIVKE
ncbi:hypothetical protein J2R98_002315 [Alkalibacillus filiformis]|uniref:Uncharacterized protein n=1 Tax=Alkalibacillus filiformis TaxID=200990 RepID=A0ABU0DVM0_9BACI|nr:hypothetical protein [Alkalibacillus filiformis]